MSGPENIAVIIGAMKAGTTTLFEMLSQHPEIAPCRVKEPFFFASEEKFSEGIEAYRRLWRWDPSRHKIALEASTDYTKLPFVAGIPDRMAAFEGFKFRFIYMMRNPFERIESHVLHAIGTKSEIGGIVESDRDFSLNAGLTEAHIAFSKYAYQMDAFASTFGKDSLLPIVLEEYAVQPKRVLRQCCRFLGIDTSFQFKNAPRRTGRGRDTLPPSPLWATLQKIGPLRVIARTALPKDLRQDLRRKMQTKISIRRIGRYFLNDDEKRSIADRLEIDYHRLREEYSVDTVQHWGI